MPREPAEPMESTNGRVGPEVVLDVELRGESWVLVLANTGDSTAYEPRVSFRGGLRGLAETADLGRLPIWTGLAILRPGQQIDVLLDAAGADRPERRIGADVSWADAHGLRHERGFDHDLGAYDGLPSPLPR